MKFSEAIRSCLNHYTTFQGRSARSEFWFFALFAFICTISSSVIDRLLGTSFHFTSPITGVSQSLGYGYIYTIVVLALFLPNIAVTVRRLHDTGRSGWWYWIVLIPVVGAILLLVWFCSRGKPGENDYGSDPIAGGVAQTFN